MLRLAYKSARRNRWIGRRKQRPTPEPDSQVNDVGDHRRIKQKRRPELPAVQAPPPPHQPATCTQAESLVLSFFLDAERSRWLCGKRVDFHCERHDSNR